MKLAITNHPFSDWFFPNVSVRMLRLLSSLLGVITLAQVLVWMPHVHAFFTSEGYVPASYVFDTTVYSQLSVFFLYDAPWFVYIGFALLILSCLGVIFGRGGRFAAVLMWFLFISFASRFPLVFYGAIDAIHTTMFFNMFHPGEAYQPWKQGGVTERNRQVSAWSFRMIQVSLAIIYFMAGAQKIRVGTWWNGTEILNSLSTRFGAFDFSFLRNYPIIINLMSYGSWMLEVAFPFLIWNKATHKLLLVSMIGLHAGIFLVMNASFFSEIMIISLLSFVTPEDEAYVGALWSKLTKQLRAGWQRSRLVRNARG